MSIHLNLVKKNHRLNGNAVHLRLFYLFYVQNKISQKTKNLAIARFFNYQKPLSIKISRLSKWHYHALAIFFNLTITELISEVISNGFKNDFRREMTAFKYRSEYLLVGNKLNSTRNAQILRQNRFRSVTHSSDVN